MKIIMTFADYNPISQKGEEVKATSEHGLITIESNGSKVVVSHNAVEEVYRLISRTR